jgi:hypothetical protein
MFVAIANKAASSRLRPLDQSAAIGRAASPRQYQLARNWFRIGSISDELLRMRGSRDNRETEWQAIGTRLDRNST